MTVPFDLLAQLPFLELSVSAKKPIKNVKHYEDSLKVSNVAASIEHQCVDVIKMLRAVKSQARQSRTEYLLSQAAP